MKYIFTLPLFFWGITNTFAQVDIKLLKARPSFLATHKMWEATSFNPNKINQALEKNASTNPIHMMRAHSSNTQKTTYQFNSPLKMKYLSFGEALGASLLQSFFNSEVSIFNNRYSYDINNNTAINPTTHYKEVYR